MLVNVSVCAWGATPAEGSVFGLVLLLGFVYLLFSKHAVTLFMGSLQEAHSLGSPSVSFLPGILFGNLLNVIVSNLAMHIVAFLLV